MVSNIFIYLILYKILGGFMTSFSSFLRKSGDSFVITVPIGLVRAMNAKVGEMLQVKVEKSKQKKDGFGMFPDIKGFSRDPDRF